MEVTIRKLIFSLLLLVIMLMVSCGNSGSSKIKAENEISFDTISINKRQHLDNDSTRPFCDISVNFVYPVKSAKTNLDTLQRFFVGNMFGPSFEDLKPLAAVEARSEEHTSELQSRPHLVCRLRPAQQKHA